MSKSVSVLPRKGGYSIRRQGDVYQVFFGRYGKHSTPAYTTRDLQRAVEWRDKHKL